MRAAFTNTPNAHRQAASTNDAEKVHVYDPASRRIVYARLLDLGANHFVFESGNGWVFKDRMKFKGFEIRRGWSGEEDDER